MKENKTKFALLLLIFYFFKMDALIQERESSWGNPVAQPPRRCRAQQQCERSATERATEEAEGRRRGWGGVGESSSLPFSPLSRPKLIHPPVVSGPALIEQLARLLPASVVKWR